MGEVVKQVAVPQIQTVERVLEVPQVQTIVENVVAAPMMAAPVMAAPVIETIAPGYGGYGGFASTVGAPIMGATTVGAGYGGFGAPVVETIAPGYGGFGEPMVGSISASLPMA